MKKILISAFAVLATSSAFAANLYSNQSSNVNWGQLNAVSTSFNGTAAPSGGFWSEVQSEGGFVNTNAGSTVTGAFRLADNFTVSAGGWNVDGFKVYAYQTGSTSNPVGSGTMNIWSAGGPAGGGSIVGTATFASASDVIDTQLGTGNVFRIFNSSPGTTAPGTTRRLWEISFNASLSLSAGEYWLDYGLTAANAGTMFNPTTTHQGLRGIAGANAVQFNGTSWVGITDAGTATGAPVVAQDLPFIVSGEAVPEPATMGLLALGAAFVARRRKNSK